MWIRSLIIILSLGLLSAIFYYFSTSASINEVSKEGIVPIEIAPIVIPEKSIEFSIEKRENGGLVSVVGNFSSEQSLKTITTLLVNEKIYHEVIVDPILVDDEEVLVLLYKVLPILSEQYSRWFIRYKDHKLLLDGLTSSKESLEKIDTLLAYSGVNSFNNTTLKEQELDKSAVVVLDELKRVTMKENPSLESFPSKDDVESILSDLEQVVPYNDRTQSQSLVIQESLEKNKSLLSKHKKDSPKSKKRSKNSSKKHRIVKRSHKKVKKVERKFHLKKSHLKKSLSSAKIVKHNKSPKVTLKESTSHEDIMDLPMIQPVDMDIEEKIKKGIIPPLRTKKPLVKEGTVILKPKVAPQIDEDIPWAKLHDPDEKLNGIVLDDVVASPDMVKIE